MNSRVSEHVVRQLSATGFALIDPVIARQLSYDLLWATQMNALADFTKAQPKIAQFLGTLARVSIFGVRFTGSETWTPVGARSDDDLARRIEQVTGRHVEGLRPFNPVVKQPMPANAAVKDEPPPYPCQARRDWFERKNLEDPNLLKQPARFAPRRQRF